MSAETLFRIHLVLGYVAWPLCFGAYIWPRLKMMDRVEAHRAIATLHSFRFFGLVFILPGVVGNLPAGFATFAAYGDFATGLIYSGKKVYSVEPLGNWKVAIVELDQRKFPKD